MMSCIERSSVQFDTSFLVLQLCQKTTGIFLLLIGSDFNFESCLFSLDLSADEDGLLSSFQKVRPRQGVSACRDGGEAPANRGRSTTNTAEGSTAITIHWHMEETQGGWSFVSHDQLNKLSQVMKLLTLCLVVVSVTQEFGLGRSLFSRWGRPHNIWGTAPDSKKGSASPEGKKSGEKGEDEPHIQY